MLIIIGLLELIIAQGLRLLSVGGKMGLWWRVSCYDTMPRMGSESIEDVRSGVEGAETDEGREEYFPIPNSPILHRQSRVGSF